MSKIYRICDLWYLLKKKQIEMKRMWHKNLFEIWNWCGGPVVPGWKGERDWQQLPWPGVAFLFVLCCKQFTRHGNPTTFCCKSEIFYCRDVRLGQRRLLWINEDFFLHFLRCLFGGRGDTERNIKPEENITKVQQSKESIRVPGDKDWTFLLKTTMFCRITFGCLNVNM